MNDGRWDHQGACSVWYDAQDFPTALIYRPNDASVWHLKWINNAKPESELGTDRDGALTQATNQIRESVLGKP